MSASVVYACEDCGEEAPNYASVCVRCGASVKRVDPALVASMRAIEAVVWDATSLRVEVDRLREALHDIANVDPVDAALDPTRPLRIASEALRRHTADGSGNP